MKQVLFVLGSLVWALVVFLVTFRVTFPSDAMSERIRYEVPQRLGEAYSADVGGVAPWWTGIAVSDLKLYHLGEAPEEEEPVEGEEPQEPPPVAGPELVALVKRFAVRLDPLRSLFARAPHISGSLGLSEGSIDYSVGTGLDKRGEITVADLTVRAVDVPLADLMSVAGASGDGKLGLELDLHAGESGTPRDAAGRMVVHGKDLLLSDLEAPGIGPLGMDLPVSELNVVIDFVDGKGTISEGKATSELATLGLSGEITLREPLERSAFDVTLNLSNLSGTLTSFEGLMSSAKQSDGTYQFTCRGTLARIGSANCSMRSASVSTRPRGSTRSGGAALGLPGDAGAPVTDEDRDKHREEIRARLAARRAEREAARTGGVATPTEPDPNVVDEGEDEDPLPDEGLPDEEVDPEPIE
ncbi:MAG: type II secretion system protein GspN [Myxococcota bacterium]